MDYFNEISFTIEYIEENIKANISVEEVCKHIHMSKYHFQRLFKSIVEDSFMSYIKKRKLSEASVLLRNSNKGILDIAVEFGFNSNETFTRSFKSLFGMTPKDYRSSGEDIKLYKKINILERKMFIQSVGCLISWEVVELPELKIAGLQCIGRNKKAVKMLWKELYDYSKEVNNIINTDLHYNVISPDYSDESGIYLGGFNVSDFDDIPSKFVLRKIRSQKYARFIHEAESDLEKCSETKHLQETLKLIYDTWLPNTNYEIADVGFDRIIVSDEKNLMDLKRKSIIEIFIPLKETEAEIDKF